jgi:hypothetical protein
VAGHVEFNREKFEQLIIYLAKRLPPEAALGRVKLAKLLMHSDFTAYRRLGKSITGVTYEKWEHGHFPTALNKVEAELENRGWLKVKEVDYYGKRLKHVTAERDPHMADFSEDEIAIIEGAIRLYGHESATYLSWLSHQELGWQLTEDHQKIPYDTSLIGDVRPPESVFEELRALHGLS